MIVSISISAQLFTGQREYYIIVSTKLKRMNMKNDNMRFMRKKNKVIRVSYYP